MNADKYDAVIPPGGTTVPNDRSHTLRQWWIAITTLLMVAVFIETAFAGAMLSGIGWARNAHSANATFLIVATIAAGLVSLVTLRRIPYGLKLGLNLLSLGAVILLQAALGALSAKGANLMWVHVPLGVALFGFAGHAAASARRLSQE
jgi:hypothetical protein